MLKSYLLFNVLLHRSTWYWGGKKKRFKLLWTKVTSQRARHSAHHPPIKQHKMQHIIIRSKQSPILNHPQREAREKCYCIQNRPQVSPPFQPKRNSQCADGNWGREGGISHQACRELRVIWPCFLMKLLSNQHGENEKCCSDTKGNRGVEDPWWCRHGWTKAQRDARLFLVYCTEGSSYHSKSR